MCASHAIANTTDNMSFKLKQHKTDPNYLASGEDIENALISLGHKPNNIGVMDGKNRAIVHVGNHWIGLKKINGVWHNMDSKKKSKLDETLTDKKIRDLLGSRIQGMITFKK